MSTAAPAPGKRPYRSSLFIGGCALLAALFVAAGCRRPVAVKPADTDSRARPADDTLKPALEALYRRADLSACRAAVRQLNVHLGRHPEEKPAPLDAKAQEWLQKELGLDKDELAELNSSTFTPLDAHHLDQCFLMRDAIRSLDVDSLPPLDQGIAAFAWVMRNVRAEQRNEVVLPEQFVLRRGRGTSLERALVFLAVLDQLGLDGALVAFPRQDQASHWLAGLLVGRDLYLFDPGLGLPLPLPGPGGTPATLAQLRAQPTLVEKLTVDPQYPFGVTAEQAKAAEVYLSCPLSALAPRMKYLDDRLRATNKVSLSDDFPGRLEKVRAALGPTVPVKTWDKPDQPLAPTRALRQFLAADEGGADVRQAFSLVSLEGFAGPGDLNQPLPLLREEVFQFEMVPWTALPAPLRAIPWRIELGFKVRQLFAGQFAGFYTAPGQPRDLLLRGDLTAAVDQLVALRDQIEQNRVLVRSAPNLEQQVAAWCERAKEVQAEVLRARDAVKAARDPNAAAALEEAQANYDLLWKAGEKPLSLILAKSSAEPLGAEIDYHLALCKQEQAERRGLALRRPDAARTPADVQAAKEAWATAASWWVTFEQEHAGAPTAATARALHARACEELGDRRAAAGLLKDLSGRLTDLDKAGRLLRARQLEQANAGK